MSRSFARALVLVLLFSPAAAPAQEATPTPDTALKRLKDGNARFVADKPTTRDVTAKRRAELAKGQKPFAIVLTCADSRVAPELVFDQGLGDVFVVRVAGNIADPNGIGSIEYAVEHLKSPLVVLLGHESCGAVDAALKGVELHGDLGKLIKQVHVLKELPKEKAEQLPAAVKANALFQTAQLTKRSTVLKDFADSKRIRIVPAVYSLKSGEVKWLE